MAPQKAFKGLTFLLQCLEDLFLSCRSIFLYAIHHTVLPVPHYWTQSLFLECNFTSLSGCNNITPVGAKSLKLIKCDTGANLQRYRRVTVSQLLCSIAWREDKDAYEEESQARSVWLDFPGCNGCSCPGGSVRQCLVLAASMA